MRLFRLHWWSGIVNVAKGWLVELLLGAYLERPKERLDRLSKHDASFQSTGVAIDEVN
jgi:hypothetical protein